VILAHKDVHENLRDTFVSRASEITTGYGLDENVQMGPVISASHRDRVLAHIERGVEQGAKLSLDGRGVIVEGYENGYFVGPTVFDDVLPDMGIANEEIFGPVASIIIVEGFEEALKIIERNPFGNAASIYTNNGGLAREFKHRTGCGNIGINIGVVAPMSFFAFGGYKESFFGDIHGQVDSIDFFTERKIVISRWY
jgi:malonate-semialdehyde dehydrogenase (acetylating)/methylmalonate-semialdehyde dehydrogenase